MPNSEEYVKRGGICKTRRKHLITTTGRTFSLHHSATISYHFDKIFTPNALEMTLLSNDVKLREWLDILEVIGCWTWNWQYLLWNFKFDDRKHQIHPILFPHQSLYAVPNHLPIICQTLIIWNFSFPSNWSFERHDHWKWIWLTAAEKNEWTCWTRSTGLL
jgi:hypothetical protein